MYTGHYCSSDNVFCGVFDPDSAERIEATVQQLEMDAAEARQRAEDLAKGPDKETLDSPELTRFENTYMEIERPRGEHRQFQKGYAD